MFRKLLMLVLCALHVQHDRQCRINSRVHFNEPLPVIIREGKLLEPTDNSGTVELNNGDAVTLSCEGAGSIQHANVLREVTTASVTCDVGDTFKNDDWLSAPSAFSGFRCPEPPVYTSRRSNRSCYGGNTIIEVGYRINNNFYPVYESCFNELAFSVVYSKYTQKPYNAYYQTKVVRPFFIPDDNFGAIPVDTLFSKRGQRAAVAELVGPMVENYVTEKEFLSRGHLAAKTDFVFAFGERATFHYVNCAPQWVGLNGGNWNTLEVDLRNHINLVGYNTIIYTGVHGVSQLYNHFGRRVGIFLYTDQNNNPVIPVPLYFYKAVYEPETSRGVVFVGINNPYYTPTEFREMTFCEDICRGNNLFHWLTWHPDNPNEGYTFCCTIPDFRETIKHLPPFEVHSILY